MLAIRFSKYLKNRGVRHAIWVDKESPLVNLVADDQIVSDESGLESLGSITNILLMGKVDLNIKDVPAFRGTRVLLWVLHPHAIYSALFPGWDRIVHYIGFRLSWFFVVLFRQHRHELNKLFWRLARSKSILFMDGATRRGFQSVIDEDFLDIDIVPVPVDCCYKGKGKSNENTLDIGYFGRMDEMKYSALKGVLDSGVWGKLSNKSINLHYVGNGGMDRKLEELCCRRGINLIGYGFMENEQARILLRDKTDVVFAMGTAALDMAAVGQAVIMIDPSVSIWARKQKYFNIVSDIRDYTLGEYRGSTRYIEGKRSLIDALNICLDNRNDVGMGCYDYVKENHGADAIFERLLNAILSSQLKFESYSISLHALSETIKNVNNTYMAIGKIFRLVA